MTRREIIPRKSEKETPLANLGQSATVTWKTNVETAGSIFYDNGSERVRVP